MIEENDLFDLDPESIKRKLIKQQQVEMRKRMDDQMNDDPYMENVYDFHKYTADPSLKRTTNIKEIDKNWVFGNYNLKDEKVILMNEELLTDIDYLLPTETKNQLIKTSILREIFSRITVSRGRKGFAAKLFVTQIGSTKAHISSEKEKKGFFTLKKKEA